MTKDAADLYVFRVASLRNVAMTPPYFHNGSLATLPEAVKVMARVQLGVTLNDADTRDIVAFLESLTGERRRISPRPRFFRQPPSRSEIAGAGYFGSSSGRRERTDVSRPFISRRPLPALPHFSILK
jgi:hypothetical protein